MFAFASVEGPAIFQEPKCLPQLQWRDDCCTWFSTFTVCLSQGSLPLRPWDRSRSRHHRGGRVLSVVQLLQSWRNSLREGPSRLGPCCPARRPWAKGCIPVRFEYRKQKWSLEFDHGRHPAGNRRECPDRPVHADKIRRSAPLPLLRGSEPAQARAQGRCGRCWRAAIRLQNRQQCMGFGGQMRRGGGGGCLTISAAPAARPEDSQRRRA